MVDELDEYMKNIRRLSKLSKEKIEVEKKVGHKTSKLKLPVAKEKAERKKQKERQRQQQSLSSKKRQKSATNLLRALGIIRQPVKKTAPRRRLPVQLIKQKLQDKGYQFSNRQLEQILQDYQRKRFLEKQQSQIENDRLSVNTQLMLDRLRKIQNKGFRDDERQQRVHRERRILSRAMDLTKSHYNLKKINLDFTKLPEGDKSILNAENIFKEDPIRNPSIMKSTRFSILNTKEAGNNLNF